jgi:ATP-dependent Clp protease protease subunit
VHNGVGEYWCVPKEILLYSSIYSYSVADFINAMEEAKGQDVRIRVNSPGGEVYYGYGAIAKINEHKKGKTIQVDGRADSFAAFMCCCAEDVECLDVSTFLFHRAAFPEWIESSSERFTEPMKASLNQMNAQLRAFMEGKMKAEDFKKVTGVSYDDLFSLDNRLDVVLDAKQAKKLGLVSKVTAITPQKKAEIERDVYAIAAQSVPDAPAAPAAESEPTPPTPKSNNPKTMTLEQLKRDHPEVYAEAVKAGVTKERDRVEAFMAFVDVDPEAVAKAIEAGTDLSQKQMAEFSRKALSGQKLEAIKADSTGDVKTDEAPAGEPKTALQEQVDKFAETARKNLGLDKNSK